MTIISTENDDRRKRTTSRSSKHRNRDIGFSKNMGRRRSVTSSLTKSLRNFTIGPNCFFEKDLSSTSATAGGDRFIPRRRSMRSETNACQMAMIQAGLPVDARKVIASEQEDGNQAHIKQQYHRHMASALYNLPLESLDENGNPTRILNFRRVGREKMSIRQVPRVTEFCNHSFLDTSRVLQNLDSLGSQTENLSTRNLYQGISNKPWKTLDAPGLQDDFYNNPISWGRKNVLAVALGSDIYLWHGSNGSVQKLITIPSRFGHPTSVAFCEDAPELLAVGTSMGYIATLDIETSLRVTGIAAHDNSRVGCLAWNKTTLTSGGRDSRTHLHDIRFNQGLIASYSGWHEGEICSLKWNDDGRLLASGSNCDKVCIIDSAMLPDARTDPLITFNGHKAAVKAIDWCPSRRGLIATGGGTADKTVQVWSCNSGKVYSVVNTKSQVTGIHWSRYNDGDLLSTHGFESGEMNLWNFRTQTGLQSIRKIQGNGGRTLSIAVSPDERIVAAAGSQESLNMWRIFPGCLKSPNSSPMDCHTFGVPQIR